MNKVIMKDLDQFVTQTKGWTQKFVLEAPGKFSFIVYPNFMKTLFVCSGASWKHYRWMLFGLDVHSKEVKRPKYFIHSDPIY